FRAGHCYLCLSRPRIALFVFDATPTAAPYPPSLHDALPIYASPCVRKPGESKSTCVPASARNDRLKALLSVDSPRNERGSKEHEDRKSTRLNSSHRTISYAVFCLKKKNYKPSPHTTRSSSTS